MYTMIKRAQGREYYIAILQISTDRFIQINREIKATSAIVEKYPGGLLITGMLYTLTKLRGSLHL
jgi:hypothetical protein